AASIGGTGIDVRDVAEIRVLTFARSRHFMDELQVHMRDELTICFSDPDEPITASDGAFEESRASAMEILGVSVNVGMASLLLLGIILHREVVAHLDKGVDIGCGR